MTDSKLWFRVLHITTGKTANCVSGYYILRQDRQQIVIQCITYSDRSDSKLWFIVLHIATGQTTKLWFIVFHITTGQTANCGSVYYILRQDRQQTVVQSITYSDRTDSKLWISVLHIATGQTANFGSGYYI